MIAVVDDRVALEGAEQFTVELTLPPGQPGLQLGTDRQTTVTITDNDGSGVVLFYTQLLAAFQALSLSLILFAVVSVEFDDHTIEVNEEAGQVIVCLLKNSTTSVGFNVTVASVESSPVSAEGWFRESLGLNP